MMRWATILLLSTALGGAPFQCGTESDPGNAIEETPGQALYELAQTFKEQGDERAWKKTLEHIIARYPASRFATAAQHDLDGAQTEAGDSSPGGKASHSAK